MNVDIARQLNEIPPTWVVEQLAMIYGEEIWDLPSFMNIGARGVSLSHPEEKGVILLVCAFCNKHYLEGEHSCEPGILEMMLKVEVTRKHFRNRIKEHVFFVGRCEGCGMIYWGQDN